MEELKEIITCALDQKGVLARLKAELRANVFLAVDEQDKRQGDAGIAARSDTSRRDALAASQEGGVLLDLVQEFMGWADLRFTARVFEAEARREAAHPKQRRQLAADLGLPAADGEDQPLLLLLLHAAMQGQQLQLQAGRQELKGDARPQRRGPAGTGAGLKLPLGALGAGIGAPVQPLVSSAEQLGSAAAADAPPLLPRAREGAAAADKGGDGGGGGLIAAERGHGGGGGESSAEGSEEQQDEDEQEQEQQWRWGQQHQQQRRQQQQQQDDQQRRRLFARGSEDEMPSDSGGGDPGTPGDDSFDAPALPGLSPGPIADTAASNLRSSAASAAAAGAGMAPLLSPPGSDGPGDAHRLFSDDSPSPGAHSQGSREPSEGASPTSRHLPLHLVPLQPARRLAPLPAAQHRAQAATEIAGADRASPAAGESAGSPQQQHIPEPSAAPWSAGSAAQPQRQAQQTEARGAPPAAWGAGARGPQPQRPQQLQEGGGGGGSAYAIERVIDDSFEDDLPEELPSEVQDEESSQLFTVLRPAAAPAPAPGPSTGGRPTAAAAGLRGSEELRIEDSGASESSGRGGGSSGDGDGSDDGSEYLAESLRVGGGAAGAAAAAGPGAGFFAGGRPGLDGDDEDDDEF